MVYLDYNATAPVLPEVRDAVCAMVSEMVPMNPSAVYSLGQKARDKIERARFEILNIVCGGNIKDYNLYFVPSATIGNAQIMRSHDCVFASKNNHVSVKKNATNHIKINTRGYTDLDNLSDLINSFEAPFLVSICHANSEIGVIDNIEEIRNIVKKRNGYLHIDAVQSFGKIVDNLSVMDADYYVVSGHKIGSILGSAAIICKKNAPLEPLFFGGGQEFGMFAGTENIISAVSFALACKLINIKHYQSYVGTIMCTLESEIERCGGAIVAKDSNRIPNTAMVLHPSQDSKSQLIKLDMNNICVSIGSACTSGSVKIPEILSDMQIGSNISERAIRVSIGLGNTIADINSFIDVWHG